MYGNTICVSHQYYESFTLLFGVHMVDYNNKLFYFVKIIINLPTVQQKLKPN